MATQKQVKKSHYEFSHYMTHNRWFSLWYQLQEVTKVAPKSVLEIGPGPGVFQQLCAKSGIIVETLDIDPELKPDHVASVFDMPFKDANYDVVCAFQMLEHLPFEDSLKAFAEMVRVAQKRVIISLPDSHIRYPISIKLPRFGRKTWLIPKPSFGKKEHVFDGQHYWELNKAGYSITSVKNKLLENKNIKLVDDYWVPENPFHYFFVFEKIDD